MQAISRYQRRAALREPCVAPGYPQKYDINTRCASTNQGPDGLPAPPPGSPGGRG